jgi:hypothetical protein
MRSQIRVIQYALSGCLLWAVPAFSTPDQLLGVASCAGSTCHAATRAFEGRQIRQDEYFVWQRQDRHAQAFRTLQGERARGIAARLGWGSPEQAEGCLVCHAQAAEPARRGAKFDIEEGLGCETCHGAAERWISGHAEFKDADRKIAQGMTATWDAETRAKLCSGCHVADTDHPVTHAMMAAGHPPLLFELDTFTALMPPHWTVDADYLQRKPAPDAARNWIEGQIAAADAYLARLESGAGSHAAFPELSLFDCNACHHPLTAGRWQPGRTPERAPGSIPLADQPLLLLQAALQVLAPAQAVQASAERIRLYRQYDAGFGPLKAQAAQTRRWLLSQAVPVLRKSSPTAAQLRQILRSVVDAAQASQAGDFHYAQQAAMATQVLAAAMAERGAPVPALRKASDVLYEAVKSREHFEPATYRRALERVEAAL